MNNRTRQEAAAEWQRIREQTLATHEVVGPAATWEGGPRPGRVFGTAWHPEYAAFLASVIEAEAREEARRGHGVGFLTLEDYEAFVAERARKAALRRRPGRIRRRDDDLADSPWRADL